MTTQHPFTERTFSAPDSLKLYARIYGDDVSGRLPVVCLAGLTRNARDFHTLAMHLSRHPTSPRKVIAFDYRGRGRSAYDPDWRNYALQVEADDLLAGLTALGIEHAAFVGTSRGGLIIHLLAAMRPGAIRAVVLNDVGPVVEGAGLAQIRAYLEHAPKPKTFAEATTILKAANGPAFPALQDADWERMARAIYRDDNGRPVPDFDQALLKTIRSIDFNKPLPVLWPQFHGLRRMPMLAIRGENSSLLSASTLEEMARRHPDIDAVTVEGQGHPPMLETAELPARIAAFLDKADARSAR